MPSAIRPIARVLSAAAIALVCSVVAILGAPSAAGAPSGSKDAVPLPALPGLPAAGSAPRTRLAPAPGEGRRADPASVVKTGKLREGPSRSSRAIATVHEGSRVDVTGMAGPWARVRVAGGQSGWLAVDTVRIGGETREASGGWLRKLTGALRRTGSRQPSGGGDAVTVGVRGLTAEQVRNARPSVARVDALERIAVNGPQARARASEVGLTSRNVSIGRHSPDAGPVHVASRVLAGADR